MKTIENAGGKAAKLRRAYGIALDIILELEQEFAVEDFDDIQDEDVREIANLISEARFNLDEAATKIEKGGEL